MVHQRVEMVAQMMRRRWSRERTMLRCNRWRLADVPFRKFWSSRSTVRCSVIRSRRYHGRRLWWLRVTRHRKTSTAAAALLTLAFVTPADFSLPQSHAVHLLTKNLGIREEKIDFFVTSNFKEGMHKIEPLRFDFLSRFWWKSLKKSPDFLNNVFNVPFFVSYSFSVPSFFLLNFQIIFFYLTQSLTVVSCV